MIFCNIILKVSSSLKASDASLSPFSVFCYRALRCRLTGLHQDFCTLYSTFWICNVFKVFLCIFCYVVLDIWGVQQKQKLAGRVAEELQFFSPSQLFLSVNLHSTLDIRLFQSLAACIPVGYSQRRSPFLLSLCTIRQGYRFPGCKVQTGFLLWPKCRVPMLQSTSNSFLLCPF